MRSKLLCLLAALLLVGTVFAPAAVAQSSIGLASIDTPSSGDLALNITDLTGANDTLSPDFPSEVTTQVDFSSVALYFNGSLTATPYSFSPNGDGHSLDGDTGQFASFFDVFTELTITGDLSTTTLNVAGVGSETVASTFSATITDPTDLADGDYVYIVTTPASSGTPVTPEPEPFVMVGTGLAALAGIRRRFLMAFVRRFAVGGF
jgi:hypothetical protein